MIKIKIFIILIFSLFFNLSFHANTSVKLSEIYVDLEDVASIKRGSRVFFDYCQGCHSLKYMRYTDLAEGLNIDGNASSTLIREHFLHSTDVISETSAILSSITKESAAKWFGKVPPDLSLVSRYRSPNWIYTYMKAFYKDSSRPWGVNNVVFPDVGMPHVLLSLQGVQVLKENASHYPNIENMFYLTENGILSKEKYDLLVKDLVNFLSYVGEPTKTKREELGLFVVIFLVALSVLLYFIKKYYWEDVK